ncbi:hypothetical protein BV22DRAFT_985058, partial [Leucogyrophana mollusca]
KLVNKLPRRHTSLLFQLRSNHVPLNKHLHKIGALDVEPSSPTCRACGDREETVHHFILTCPAYARQRAAMFLALPPRSRTLSSLLNNPKSVKLLFKYISSTRRFESTFGN